MESAPSGLLESAGSVHAETSERSTPSERRLLSLLILPLTLVYPYFVHVIKDAKIYVRFHDQTECMVEPSFTLIPAQRSRQTTPRPRVICVHHRVARSR